MRTPIGTNAPALLYAKSGPEHVVVDATNVYWSTSGGLFKAPTSGAGPVVSLGIAGARSLTQNAFALFATLDADVWYVPKNGGVPARLSRNGITGSFKGIGFSPSNTAYFIDRQLATPSRAYLQWGLGLATRESVEIPPAPAPNTEALAQIASDDCSVYFAWGGPIYVVKLWQTVGAPKIVPAYANGNGSSGTRRIALDATHLYWLSRTNFIGRVPR